MAVSSWWHRDGGSRWSVERVDLDSGLIFTERKAFRWKIRSDCFRCHKVESGWNNNAFGNPLSRFLCLAVCVCVSSCLPPSLHLSTQYVCLYIYLSVEQFVLLCLSVSLCLCLCLSL